MLLATLLIANCNVINTDKVRNYMVETFKYIKRSVLSQCEICGAHVYTACVF